MGLLEYSTDRQELRQPELDIFVVCCLVARQIKYFTLHSHDTRDGVPLSYLTANKTKL